MNYNVWLGVDLTYSRKNCGTHSAYNERVAGMKMALARTG